MTNDLWSKAKKYLLPYDGGASQIHMLGLENKRVANILDVSARYLADPGITMVAGTSQEPAAELEHFIENKDRVRDILPGRSIISGKIFENRADITLDMWSEGQGETFDLEVWFWADQFFPGNDSANKDRFHRLLDLLKQIAGQAAYKTILTTCEAGDPVEDLEKGLAIELDISST